MIKFKNFALQSIDRPLQNVEANFKKINLATNVPYDITINNIAKQLLAEVDLSQYPHPYSSYLAISTYYQVSYNKITIGYGATEIIERILKTVEIPHLYIMQPAFEMVQVYCKIYNIPYTFIHDLEAVKPGSFLYISNPNGNNGESYDLLPIVDKCTLVIADEVYADFYNNSSLLSKDFDNVIIVKSLSKSLGLAGLRFGFCISSAKIANMLNKTRSNHIINAVSAHLVPRLINYIPEVVDRLLYSKKYLETHFNCKNPSYGNYVLFRNSNMYTDIFGSKKIGDFYRMTLADYDTLTNWSTSHHSLVT